MEATKSANKDEKQKTDLNAPKMSKATALALTISIGFHAFFEGMAMGLLDEAGALW